MSLTDKPAPVQLDCHEHSRESFQALIDAIERLGIPREISAKYAVLIGDTPFIDEAGKTVVIDRQGKELVRLELDFFSTGENRQKRNPNDPEFYFLYQAMKRHGIEDRKAARWSALVDLSGGPKIGEDGKFPVIDERGRELARLPADVLTKRGIYKPPEIYYLDGGDRPV